MSLRFSIEDGLRLGLITETEAQKMRTVSRRLSSLPAPKAPGRSLTAATGRKGSPAQDRLWRAVQERWPGRFEWEFKGAVPGRGFRLDIASPGDRLALEVDGYRYHGLSKSGFKRDRERDRLLTCQGWRILRFFASEIRYDNMSAVLSIITQALEQKSYDAADLSK